MGTASRTASVSTGGESHAYAAPRRIPYSVLSVRQVRSRISELPDRRDTLRALGLRKIGWETVKDATLPSTRGQLALVGDLVELTEVVLSDGEIWDLNARPEPNMDEFMTHTDYKARGLPSREFRFADGEYLTAENHGDDFALVWSTRMPLRAMLRRVVQRHLVPDLKGEAVILLRGEEHREVPAEEALDLVRRRGNEVLFLRLDLLDTTLTWKAPKSRIKARRAHPSLGEIGFSARRFDSGQCIELVHSTATLRVGRSARRVLTDAVLSKFPGK